jgi:hypothetical protein
LEHQSIRRRIACRIQVYSKKERLVEMGYRKYLVNALIGATAVVVAGARLVPGSDETGPVMRAAAAFVSDKPFAADSGVPGRGTSPVSVNITAALAAFTSVVRPLSHPRALEDAFRGYFAYKAAHPDDVKKPYLYFVDYGLPSTAPRGYVFDMDAHKIVDGPFMVAHGRGSSTKHDGVPTRFANEMGAATSSLGLFVCARDLCLPRILGRTGVRLHRSAPHGRVRQLQRQSARSRRRRARRAVRHAGESGTQRRLPRDGAIARKPVASQARERRTGVPLCAGLGVDDPRPVGRGRRRVV